MKRSLLASQNHRADHYRTIAGQLLKPHCCEVRIHRQCPERTDALTQKFYFPDLSRYILKRLTRLRLRLSRNYCPEIAITDLQECWFIVSEQAELHLAKIDSSPVGGSRPRQEFTQTQANNAPSERRRLSPDGIVHQHPASPPNSLTAMLTLRSGQPAI